MDRVLQRARWLRLCLFVAITGAGGTACAANPLPAPEPAPEVDAPVSAVNMQAVIDAALDDAAARMGRPRTELRVITAEAVTWPDGSLGCPEEGRGYTDALVRGFRVRIGTSAKDWIEYHAGMDGKPFHCPSERVRPPFPDDGV